MPTGRDIRTRIEALAPPALAESWDNVGWQVGHDEIDVTHILLALDFDAGVLAEARDIEADLIVTHHPLLFHALQRIDTTTPIGHLIAALITDERSLYAAHTNLDAVRGGVNGALAGALDLPEPAAPLRPVEGAPDEWGFGAICETAGISTTDLTHRVHENLGTPHPRVTDGGVREHELVALLGGSGAQFIDDAVAAGCTCLITGELKYHDGQKARALGLTVIEADHYYSEAPVLPALREWLAPLDIPITVSTQPTTPFMPDWEAFT